MATGEFGEYKHFFFPIKALMKPQISVTGQQGAADQFLMMVDFGGRVVDTGVQSTEVTVRLTPLLDIRVRYQKECGSKNLLSFFLLSGSAEKNTADTCTRHRSP